VVKFVHEKKVPPPRPQISCDNLLQLVRNTYIVSVYTLLFLYEMCLWSRALLEKVLTLILLTWRIWWAPNNASRWQMGFNSAFEGLIPYKIQETSTSNGRWISLPCSQKHTIFFCFHPSRVYSPILVSFKSFLILSLHLRKWRKLFFFSSFHTNILYFHKLVCCIILLKVDAINLLILDRITALIVWRVSLYCFNAQLNLLRLLLSRKSDHDFMKRKSKFGPQTKVSKEKLTNWIANFGLAA